VSLPHKSLCTSLRLKQLNFTDVDNFVRKYARAVLSNRSLVVGEPRKRDQTILDLLIFLIRFENIVKSISSL
jgi:hypothetical protein